MSPSTKIVLILGLTFGSVLSLLANPAPAKFISIRFHQTDKPTVYVSDASLSPVADLTYTKELTTFFVETGERGGELSLQIAPWTGEYESTVIWHLKSQWSVGQKGILNSDLNKSKGPGGNTGLTSYGKIQFSYDKATDELSWVQAGAQGSFKLAGNSQGCYLILKLANDSEGKVTDLSGGLISQK